MSSLLSFVQTGQLGPIALGTTRAEVEAAFGPPGDWFSGHEMPDSPIWRYGNVELHFSGDEFFLIFCDNFDVPDGATIAFDTAELGQGTEPEVESWLREHEIQFEKKPYPWAKGVLVFYVSSGVELKVYTEDADFSNCSYSTRLCAVSRMAR